MERHDLLRAYPPTDQGVRQPVGPAVQFAVGDRLVAPQESRGSGKALDDLSEGRGKSGFARVAGCRISPLNEQLVALTGGQERQRRHRRLGRGGGGGQKPDQVVQQASDGDRVEQLATVCEGGVPALVSPVDGEHQVEFGGDLGPLLPVHREAREPQLLARCLQEGEQDLEQGGLREGTLGLQLLDQLLERQLLVQIGFEDRGAHPGQSLT